MVQSPLFQSQRPRPGIRPGFGGVMVGLLLLGCTIQPVGEGGGSAVASYEAQLAQHLTATGGVMYGAYWCPHCADQIAMFQQAADQVPYIECAADGLNAQPDLCRQKGVKGYPTWEIEGQLYPGVKSLGDLAAMSGFAPPQ
jgi:hypothetical protein